MKKLRIYVLHGQGGWLTSNGMDAFAIRLRSIPNCEVSIHDWNDQQRVVDSIRALRLDVTVIIIGYSLGANAAPRVAGYLKGRRVDLIIGLDPSRLQGMPSVPANVVRAVCFYNPGVWIFGGACYQGKQVTRVNINDFHLDVDWDPALWNRTIQEVEVERTRTSL